MNKQTHADTSDVFEAIVAHCTDTTNFSKML